MAGRASSLLGEEGANDTHLARKVRRSATARGLMTKPEPASKGRVTKPSPKDEPKQAKVPEDNPEIVAAMGRWCAGHVSKQVRAISLRSCHACENLDRPLHASTCLGRPGRPSMQALTTALHASTCLGSCLGTCLCRPGI